MKISFVTVSSKLPSWLDELAEDYKKKLSYWADVEIRVLGGRSLGRAAREKKKEEESDLLLEFLRPSDLVVLCDEKGSSMDSLKFSRWLDRAMASGKQRIVILIGGAYGVSEELKARADFQLRLSDLTTTHHMALAFVMEQVYRGMTILKNVSYHNI